MKIYIGVCVTEDDEIMFVGDYEGGFSEGSGDFMEIFRNREQLQELINEISVSFPKYQYSIREFEI